MKKMLLMLIPLLSVVSLQAQETGIRFENGSYSEALEKAKQEVKYLFIDCYTTWCVPCKMLEKEVFTDKKVADYFNAKFVSLRLDVEKGEGIELRKRFGVQPVPTLLFINADGEVEHKFIGASTVDEFLKSTDEVFTKENRYGVLQRKFKGGDRDLAFIAEYINELLHQSEFSKAKDLLKEVMNSTPEEQLCAKEFWPILTQNFIAERGSSIYAFLIRNRKLLQKNVGEEVYKQKMSQTFIRYANIWVFSGEKEYDRKVFDDLRRDIKPLSLPDEEGVLFHLDLAEARVKKDFDAFVSLMEKSAGRITPENTYSILINSSFFPLDGTAEQCKRFLAVIDAFLKASQNENYQKRLSRLADDLKVKAGQNK